MSETKVIIVGCGIAGPVLATFLKLKGYNVVVYERFKSDRESGSRLLLQPNGLRVLSLISGLDADQIPGQYIERMCFRSWMPEENATLAESDVPAKAKLRFGYQMKAVERTGFRRLIAQIARDHGVEIHWEHTLVSLEQGVDEVTLNFENGHTDTASFVIGCDGIHSNTRGSIFGHEKPDFTGFIQTAGESLTPNAYLGKYTLTNIYSNGAAMVVYPVNPTTTAWAVTQRGDEAKDTWRFAVDQQMQEDFKNGPLADWGFEGEGLVKSAKKMVKYGLYDRPELKSWHKGRVVLLGDAAHPTTPHLGQGANQAFEDIYHLVRLLVRHNPTASSPSTELLSTIFSEYESIRLPKAAALVQGAKKMGESRIVGGVEMCLARNMTVRKNWEDDENVLNTMSPSLSGPFEGESEI
ncbi:hypothetical protein PILCRDRAFT_810062 [Piloderma croceum F 1598]|uniref:FAD-binding domain-containing protein n=1 Tax=Piloderma croceum (strain F 1598) TaxID=765440 RepID=A0A0C3G734_PILCF|nr:hypothetical protein PILCRDRAFT_810062 [Piloderma croceum F 1598]